MSSNTTVTSTSIASTTTTTEVSPSPVVTNIFGINEEYTGLIIFFALCCMFVILTMFYFEEKDNPLFNYQILQQSENKDLEAQNHENEEIQISR